MTKTYTTSTDLIGQEIEPILVEDDQIRDLDHDQIRTIAREVYDRLDAAGMIQWQDGFSESDGNFHLNQQGFALVMDEALEGADFWEVVAAVLDAK